LRKLIIRKLNPAIELVESRPLARSLSPGCLPVGLQEDEPPSCREQLMLQLSMLNDQEPG
jgi:hypothetical protein